MATGVMWPSIGAGALDGTVLFDFLRNRRGGFTKIFGDLTKRAFSIKLLHDPLTILHRQMFVF
jgi:hypothetical protein